MALPTPEGYRPLNARTLPPFLADIAGLGDRLGGQSNQWRVEEVGDGNLNLVFLVDGPSGSVCVKQALPYVRLVGESWPLPLERAFFEYTCLSQHGAHVGSLVPKVLHYDAKLFAIIMEKLSPHIIMRQGMIDGVLYPKAAGDLAEYCAQTLFHTSDLALTAAEKKARMAVFCANTALCKITEDLIFTDPYRVSELNHWTSPQLDDAKAHFERDPELKLAISRLKVKFMGAPEALIHGDLHTGSVMLTPDDTKIIDPEFAFYGPRGFDLGAVMGNLLINYFAQDGHEAEGRPSKTPRAAYQVWVLEILVEFWQRFEARFLDLWQAGGRGDAYPPELFADPRSAKALMGERQDFMARMFTDAVQFAGAKMIRRILGLAHNIDLDWITDPQIRSLAEHRCLALAQDMLVRPEMFKSPQSVADRAVLIRSKG